MMADKMDTPEIAFLKELRQAMVELDFMHWRYRGRAKWVIRINDVLGNIPIVNLPNEKTNG